MVDISKHIQSLTTFRRRPGDFMKQLKRSKRPILLTVKGKAAAVVQDAEAYQRLRDIAARADATEGIRQGLEDARRAKTRPVREFLAEFVPAKVEAMDKPKRLVRWRLQPQAFDHREVLTALADECEVPLHRGSGDQRIECEQAPGFRVPLEQIVRKLADGCINVDHGVCRYQRVDTNQVLLVPCADVTRADCP